MRCQRCKRPSLITCKYCNLDFCAGCIQLEIHGCSNIQEKRDELLKNLSEKLVKVVAPKKLHS